MQSTNTIDYWIFAVACWSFSFRAKIHANYLLQQYQITYFIKEFAVVFCFFFFIRSVSIVLAGCGPTVLINTFAVIFVDLICMDRGNFPTIHLHRIIFEIHLVVYHINILNSMVIWLIWNFTLRYRFNAR